jgi:hypothetical protein
MSEEKRIEEMVLTRQSVEAGDFKYSSTIGPVAWLKYSSTQDEPNEKTGDQAYAILCDMGDTLKLLFSLEEENSK